MIFLLASSIIISTTAIAVGGINASIYLHNSMLRRCLRTHMTFYDTTPLGRIINRFTREIDTVDNLLPYCFRQLLLMIFAVNQVTINWEVLDRAGFLRFHRLLVSCKNCF